MACPNLENRCWEFFNMSPEEFLHRYSALPQYKCPDPLIKEFAAGETRQFKGTSYYYMIVEISSLPGIKIANVWDSREED